ncbi:MAG TPA: low temperature-induced protein [Chloroflexota bacterium]|nr:low temperature-induced protein [Chloroflexota bacterium]
MESHRESPQRRDAQASAETLRGMIVAAVIRRPELVHRTVEALHGAGYSEAAISILGPHDGRAPVVRSASDTNAGKGTIAGVSAGVIIGGVLTAVALAVPGIGPLIAAGPIAAFVIGGVSGGSMGALVGSFVGLGVPSDHAKAYEAAVRQGGTVVTVAVADQLAAGETAGILNEAGAEGVETFEPVL